MMDWLPEFIRTLGYWGIALLMALENVFPPIPSEVIMPLAGYWVQQHRLTIIGVIVSGTLGSVLGCWLLYYAGIKMGAEKLKAFSKRHGRWFAITPSDIDRTQVWFHRYGAWAVFGFRLVPGMRSLISIPAGVSGMKLTPFLLCTTIGAGLWTSILTLVGCILGSQFKQAQDWLGPVSSVVVLILVVWYLYKIWRQRKLAP